MSEWNLNIDDAPRGTFRTVTRKIGKTETEVHEYVSDQIIAAGNNGVVTVSKWLPDQGRWNFFSKDTPPLAWQHWPNHPYGVVR